MPSPARLDLLKTLAAKVDYLIIGGALANPFLSGQADETLAALTNAKCELIHPVDVVVAQEARDGARENIHAQTISASHIPPNLTALDLGSDSIGDIARCLEGSKALLWHGPLGACETSPFDNATLIVARHAAMLVRAGRLNCQITGVSLRAALNQADLLETLTT